MNSSGTDLSCQDEMDATLADLTAEIIGRLECGEPVKPGDYAQAYPDYVHEIDRLLPTVNTLVALGRTVACRRRPQCSRNGSEAPMTDSGGGGPRVVIEEDF